MKPSTRLCMLALSVVVIGSPITGAVAQSQWDANHPRRAEVNGRLENQNQRIHLEVREGELTRGQANQLHREDHAIRQEERDMAQQNNGHITRGEQRVLNRQENAVSGQIGR